MFKAERLHRIKEIIFERKQIDVATLSTLLNVTEVTIRNDLEQLEKSGFLTRYHGGATLNTEVFPEQQFQSVHTDSPAIPYDKEKEEVGLAASQLVKEKEWIFLGPGTTSSYIAKALSRRQNLNIMTNNFHVANIFGGNTSVQLLFLGGRMQNSGMYTVPEDLNKELEHIYLSKFFFSVDAASLEGGYTLTDMNVLDIIKAISSRCNETIMCIDSKKFDQRSFIRLGDLTYTSTVVTNNHIPPEYHQYYIEHGIRTFTSYDLKPLNL